MCERERVRWECDSDGGSLGHGKANICLLCVFGPLLPENVRATSQNGLAVSHVSRLISLFLPGVVITLKQKERRLGTIDLRTAQRLVFKTEREHPLPHVHQHIALR